MAEKFIPAVEGYTMDEMPAEFQREEALSMIGVGYNANALRDSMEFAEDEAPVTGGGMNTPWFHLNYLAKKAITVVTQKTTIDEILGRTPEGSWAHESITKQFRELTGRSAPYEDYAETTTPRVNRAYSYVTRDVIRLAAGTIVTELESRQAAMVPGQYSPNQDKREAIALLFKLDRDAIGFYGYRLNDKRCWGLLNDPRLFPFESVATGASNSTKWEKKTFHEITRDLMTAVGKVQKQLKANFVPATSAFKLVLPNGVDTYLGVVPECGGVTVREWIKNQWKKCEIVVTPVFEDALGGENVFYVIVDQVGVAAAAEQIVPASAFLVGNMKREAGHSELWSMATCGTMVLQPLGVGRFFGI